MVRLVSFLMNGYVSTVSFFSYSMKIIKAIRFIYLMLQRLNVCLTRAKCLTIIIGDAHTLKLDKNWLRVIEHCVQNNSFIQVEV